jgi:hypothetical protein
VKELIAAVIELFKKLIPIVAIEIIRRRMDRLKSEKEKASLGKEMAENALKIEQDNASRSDRDIVNDIFSSGSGKN